MRRRATMTLRGKKDLLNCIYEKIKEYAIEAKVVSDIMPIKIYKDTEGYQILLEEIKKNNIQYTFAEGREYTKDEIKSARYFVMDIIYPWESDGITADKFGTQYNLSNSCEKCGMGKEQVSELVIDTKKVAKYDIATIQPEIIINEKLYDLLTANGLTGFKFQPVRDYKGKDDINLYQLVITNVLPKMSNETRIDIEEGVYCKECKRNGVFLRSEAIL